MELLRRASNQNNSDAQVKLGVIYLLGYNIRININMGITYIENAAKNGNRGACFIIGSIYHEGKYVKQDIDKSIHYYKEVSFLKNQYAKNNLGLIYRDINIQNAIKYFTEAVNEKNDPASMVNLAIIYMSDNYGKKNINMSIKYLLNSTNYKNVKSISLHLLAIVLVKNFGMNFELIKNEIMKYKNDGLKLFNSIQQIIIMNNFKNNEVLDVHFTNFSKYKIFYYLLYHESKLTNEHESKKKCDITIDFYEGFGN